MDNTQLQQGYEEQAFWRKLARYAKVAGQELVYKALLLFYAARNPRCPRWASVAIYGALGYFISVFDAIPDLTPVLGYTDDLGVLAAALATVAVYIDDHVRQQAQATSQRWFGAAAEPGADG